MIEYIDKPWEESDVAGWHGVGWYFWDESQIYCYGPYPSKILAEKQLETYCKENL